MWFWVDQRRDTWSQQGWSEYRINDFWFLYGRSKLGKSGGYASFKTDTSPTGKLKWTRATVDHLLSNGKYVAVVGLEKFLDVQFEKAARCNIDYDKDGAPRKDTRYVSPAVVQI